MKRFSWATILLPLVGLGSMLLIWMALAKISPDFPTPLKTWELSKLYILKPFEYRGPGDQGVLLQLWRSLILVAKGYSLAIIVGTPLGFLLGSSKLFNRMYDPIVQIAKPVSPLAWLPLGAAIFQNSHAAAVFTIAICAMWPTAINTAVGVRSIPQDYLNVARVLKLSRFKTLVKILIPATLPYMFTGFRLSLGLAWLVIVAAEALTGGNGIGGFLWSEYNAQVYGHVIMCILAIGLTGFLMDRAMSAIERRLKPGGAY